MANRRTYHVVLKRQGNEGFVARCLELPGCLSEGTTRAGALRNIRDAIKLYMKDVAKEVEEKEAQAVQVTIWLSKSRKLPSLSWRHLVKALKKIGYTPTGQSGSHIILRNPEGKRVTVPRHDPIGKGLLMETIAEVGLSKEELIELLWMFCSLRPA